MKELFTNAMTKEWLTTKEAAAFFGNPAIYAPQTQQKTAGFPLLQLGEECDDKEYATQQKDKKWKKN